jgi:hypothetical protein
MCFGLSVLRCVGPRTPASLILGKAQSLEIIRVSPLRTLSNSKDGAASSACHSNPNFFDFGNAFIRTNFEVGVNECLKNAKEERALASLEAVMEI